jgi:hypothetical protein
MTPDEVAARPYSLSMVEICVAGALSAIPTTGIMAPSEQEERASTRESVSRPAALTALTATTFARHGDVHVIALPRVQPRSSRDDDAFHVLPSRLRRRRIVLRRGGHHPSVRLRFCV